MIIFESLLSTLKCVFFEAAGAVLKFGTNIKLYNHNHNHNKFNEVKLIQICETLCTNEKLLLKKVDCFVLDKL